MSATRDERFISEPVEPVAGSGLASTAARGEPALPAEFTWRLTRYRVRTIVRAWKTTGPCRHGSGEQYVRRHWYTVRVEPPATMTLYFDRSAGKDRRRRKVRWWLYSLAAGGEAGA